MDTNKHSDFNADEQALIDAVGNKYKQRYIDRFGNFDGYEHSYAYPDRVDYGYVHLHAFAHHHDVSYSNGDVDCYTHSHFNGDTDHDPNADGHPKPDADLDAALIPIERMRIRVLRDTGQRLDY